MERLDDPELARVETGVLDRERRPVGHELQQALILWRELARGLGRADLEHAAHPALDDEGHAHQRPHALVVEQRVAAVQVGLVGDRRGPVGCDPAGEALPHGQLQLAILAGRRDPVGGADREEVVAGVEQEDRRRLDRKDLADVSRELA